MSGVGAGREAGVQEWGGREKGGGGGCGGRWFGDDRNPTAERVDRVDNAGRRIGGFGHARDDEAVPGLGGGGPQVPKRAAGRQWPVRLTSNGAKSCSTRW